MASLTTSLMWSLWKVATPESGIVVNLLDIGEASMLGRNKNKYGRKSLNNNGLMLFNVYLLNMICRSMPRPGKAVKTERKSSG